MSDDTPSPLNNVITIDDERIKSHLDRVVRGTVKETLNALLDAEADRLCNAQRYERSEARHRVSQGRVPLSQTESDLGRISNLVSHTLVWVHLWVRREERQILKWNQCKWADNTESLKL